jgi:hypothetical protein
MGEVRFPPHVVRNSDHSQHSSRMDEAFAGTITALAYGKAA